MLRLARQTQIFRLDLRKNPLPPTHHLSIDKALALDFALIDGDHKFDSAFVDFYFLDLLLRPEGWIAIDDCRMPSVASLIDWIRSNKPAYQEFKTGVTGLTLWQKTGEDQRPWQHFVPFQTHPFWRKLRALLPTF